MRGGTANNCCVWGVARAVAPHAKAAVMTVHLSVIPLASLLAGVFILVMPRLLNFIVAIYLIAIGLIGLFGGNFHIR